MTDMRIRETATRRACLGATVAGLTALAGCSGSGSGSDTQASANGSSNNSSSSNASAESEGESSNSSESSNSNDGQAKLTVTEHELVESEFGSAKITGVVKNNTDRTLDYVQATAKLLDESGAQLGTAMTNTTDLEAGARWKFEIVTGKDYANVANYELTVKNTVG